MNNYGQKLTVFRDVASCRAVLYRCDFLLTTAEKEILVKTNPTGLLSSRTKHWLLNYPRFFHVCHMCVIEADVAALSLKSLKQKFLSRSL
jgi:hypothetical protein